MRRTVSALAAVLLLAACQPSTEASDATTEPAAAPPPVMPLDAPPQEEVDPALVVGPGQGKPVPFSGGRPTRESCRGEIGDLASARLVERCVRVSPATHPPCNVANPCAMIQGEIDRACAQYGPGEARPAECKA